jgi:hypothetical protein
MKHAFYVLYTSSVSSGVSRDSRKGVNAPNFYSMLASLFVEKSGEVQVKYSVKSPPSKSGIKFV